MRCCFYDQPTCSPSITREHVISATVLKAVFGESIRNFISAEFLGIKTLLDHEPVIRDVCKTCNNEKLSPYDSAGEHLIRQLIHDHDPTGLRLALTRESIGWLMKTHLNYIRVIKDRETNETYPIDKEIKSALIQGAEIPNSLYRLMVEGWIGEPFFWDENDPRRIPWFGYRSIRLIRQRIVISDLRLKTLTTWFIIPSDASYDGFDSRVSSALDEISRDFGFCLQPIDPMRAINDGYIDLTHVLPLEKVKTFIVQRSQ